MYCPNCGQQQVSDEMRFCSRCGVGLSGLAEWLARGGVPAKRGEEAPVVRFPPRKRKRAAAKLMFVSGVLLPIFFVLSLIVGDGGPMIVPLILFFVSSVIMLYSRVFRDETPVNTHGAQTTTLNSTSARGSLPPPSNVSMPGVGRQQVRTNELAQPPSVTEHTTKFLDNE